MVHYINSMSAITGAGFCSFPGRDSLVFSMAVAGLFCLAAAVAVALRGHSAAVPVTIRIDRE